MPETLLAGIDLGGTKIETTLYGPDLTALQTRRVATPQDTYANLILTVADEIAWVIGQATAPLRIGLGTPGVIDPMTGRIITGNLPATGQTLAADLAQATGQTLTIANDAQCFALSEAVGGAGHGAARVFGLTLGTGVGGGFCLDGRLHPGASGLLGEVGQIALPAHLMQQENLPLLRCGCGRTGCYETLLAGKGLTALHRHLTGETLAPPDLGNAAQTLALWHRIMAELIWTLHLTLDPDVVVIGGGLLPLVNPSQLTEALDKTAIPGPRAPHILPAHFGASSGTRGAALLARSQP